MAEGGESPKQSSDNQTSTQPDAGRKIMGGGEHGLTAISRPQTGAPDVTERSPDEPIPPEWQPTASLEEHYSVRDRRAAQPSSDEQPPQSAAENPNIGDGSGHYRRKFGSQETASSDGTPSFKNLKMPDLNDVPIPDQVDKASPTGEENHS